MCGIVGYIGTKQATPIIMRGLQRLEYRGYDSAGLAISNGSLQTLRSAGRLNELVKLVKTRQPQGVIGLGHTRWATHGEPNTANAHPHIDCAAQLAVVHNGIIENHESLRTVLEAEGHVFKSTTDSEILAHLIEKFYQGDLAAAVQQALQLVEGAFGLAALSYNEDVLVAARRSSPLVIGLGKSECLVASDATALIEHTKRVIYLADNELAILRSGNYRVHRLSGGEVDKQVHELRWTIDKIAKGGYKHFMLKEIYEQPKALQDVCRGRLHDGKLQLSLDLDVGGFDQIILTACGTSWHAATIGRYYLERLAKLTAQVDYASEFRYRDPLINSRDLLIVVSQSGETADTLAALHEAKRKKATVMGIVNSVGSTIARDADCGMYLHAGPEIGVASTKAFSVQVVSLLLFALYLREQRLGLGSDNLTNDLLRLTDLIESTLKLSDSLRVLAEKYGEAQSFLYLGRGLSLPMALEGALKLKEISYIHAEGYPAAEMKHGPIALIEPKTPTFFIAPHDSVFEKNLSNMAELKARQGSLIVLTDCADARLKGVADDVIVVPQVRPELWPLISVIPTQLFAYHVTDLKGLDVDKPRNLAKSVTVE